MLQSFPDFRRAALAVALTLGAVACGENSPPIEPSSNDPAAVEGPRESRRPHVVIFLIDTLRADHLGCYGYERDTSPFIDSLAAESVLFERAMSQAPWTLPACVSLQTSTYPVNHGIVSAHQEASDDVLTITEFLSEYGYTTAGFIHNRLGGSAGGLDQGYDELYERPSTRDITPENRELATLRPFQAWLRRQAGDEPLHAYVHTAEPHHPYQGRYSNGQRFVDLDEATRDALNKALPQHRGMQGGTDLATATPEELAAFDAMSDELLGQLDSIIGLYDGDVRRADESVKQVVTALRRKGLWDDTLFILISDHGDEFFEHGNWFHDQSVHDELVRVPLVIHFPKGVVPDSARGLRVETPAQLVDIAATIADVMGEENDPQWLGRSLLADVLGAADGVARGVRPVFSQRENVDRSLLTLKSKVGDKQTAVVRGRFKAILHQEVAQVALYDLVDDPGELHDIAGDRPQIAEELGRLIVEWLSEQSANTLAGPGQKENDEALQALLADLGYVDAPKKDAEPPDDDGEH